MDRRDTCRVRGGARIRTQARAELDWSEADPGFDSAAAVNEALRCAASSPCLYCEVCQLLCPDLAITRSANDGSIAIDLDYCKGCGLCASFCPHHAIRMIVDDSSS